VRKISLILGIAAAAVGAWTLRHVRTAASACIPHTATTGGYGISNRCLNNVWLEFFAFALIIGGVGVALVALMLMRRGREVTREAQRPGLRLLGTPGEDPELKQQLAAGVTRLPTANEPLVPLGIDLLPRPATRGERPGSRRVS